MDSGSLFEHFAKDILGDFECDVEERRVSSLTLHLKMAENVTQTQPQQESKATDSLLDMVTKQVAKKLLLQGI